MADEYPWSYAGGSTPTPRVESPPAGCAAVVGVRVEEGWFRDVLTEATGPELILVWEVPALLPPLSFEQAKRLELETTELITKIESRSFINSPY